MKITPTRVERRATRPTVESLHDPDLSLGAPAGVPGWWVEGIDDLGHRHEFSLLDGRCDWRHDAEFTAAGMPVFVHGFGSALSTFARREFQHPLDVATQEVTRIPTRSGGASATAARSAVRGSSRDS